MPTLSFAIRPNAYWYWGGKKLQVTYKDFVYTNNTAAAAPAVCHRRRSIDYVSVTTIFAFAPLACRSQASATRASG